MNSPIPNVNSFAMSPPEFIEEDVTKDANKPNSPGSSVHFMEPSLSGKKNSLSKSTDGPRVSPGVNFVAMNKPPEILAPADFSLELMQTLRLIQIEFCSADISQAASNGRQIQEGMEELNRKRHEKEIEITNEQNKVSEKAKVTKELGRALAVVGMFLSVIGVFTAAIGIGLAISVVALALSAWGLIADLIPEESRGDRQNIFGETVKWDYSLSGIIGVLCELTLASPDLGIGVEGAHTDNSKKTTMLSRSQFESYKLGWSLAINIVISLPGIIYGGSQVIKALAPAKELVTAAIDVAKPILEKFVESGVVTIIARFSSVAQMLTSLTSLGNASANAFLAGDRKAIAEKRIESQEIQKSITMLDKSFERNSDSYEVSLDFQEALRKAVAAAIFKRIEPATTIAKNIS